MTFGSNDLKQHLPVAVDQDESRTICFSSSASAQTYSGRAETGVSYVGDFSKDQIIFHDQFMQTAGNCQKCSELLLLITE